MTNNYIRVDKGRKGDSFFTFFDDTNDASVVQAARMAAYIIERLGANVDSVARGNNVRGVVAAIWKPVQGLPYREVISYVDELTLARSKLRNPRARS